MSIIFLSRMDAGNACYKNREEEVGSSMVLRQRYVSAKDVVVMGLIGDHIISKHLVKPVGSQKKQGWP